MTKESIRIFGLMQKLRKLLFKEIFIYRHHIEPRVQLYVPRKEPSLFPLNCIDVIRSTYAYLEIAQEKRSEDYWDVDENRHPSDPWTGVTRFTLLKTLLKGYKQSRERLTKIQTTSHPDHIWPDALTRIEKATQRRKKQEWVIEKLLFHAKDLFPNMHSGNRCSKKQQEPKSLKKRRDSIVLTLQVKDGILYCITTLCKNSFR